MSNEVEERVKKWKDKLIDLSLRNPLLNFRPTKVTTIKIVDELPSEILHILALEKEGMEFLPLESSNEGGIFEDDSDDNPSSEFSTYLREQIEQRHKDKYLQTKLSKEVLSHNLFRIYSKANSVIEEQGYNVLFLSLGCLEWYESDDSNVKLKAPIILVPVELSRSSVKSKFRLSYNEGEALILNPALVVKMQRDYNIILNPIDERFENVNTQQIFSIMQEVIKPYQRWRVINDIYLSLFSFAKFVMYKDLERYSNVLLENTIIKAICGDFSSQRVLSGLSSSEEDLDKKIISSKTFQVLDSDSSQQQAILAAKSGKNLVIEGPPGTGKSQTITNIIAEFLADGKKVLFVSQKMAALEVVKKRLDANGLGDFCLELHSRKANKKEVISELSRILNLQKRPDHANDEELTKLEQLKTELNEYVKAVHTPFGNLMRTPFHAFGIINAHAELPEIAYIFKDAKLWDAKKYNYCCELLDELASSLQVIGNPLAHPWYGSLATFINYEGKLKLPDLMESILKSVDDITVMLESLQNCLFFNAPDSIADTNIFLEVNTLLLQQYRYLKNRLLIFTPSFWKGRRLLKTYLREEKYRDQIKKALQNLRVIDRKMVSSEIIHPDAAKPLLDQIQDIFAKFIEEITTFIDIAKINVNDAFGANIDIVSFKNLTKKIILMKDSMDLIDSWLRYQKSFQKCLSVNLNSFINMVLERSLPLEQMIKIFQCQFLRCWLGEAFIDRPALRRFTSEDHEKIISKFCELDRKQIEMAKLRIQHFLTGRIDNNYVPTKTSELGILLRETHKTRSHMPIRKLFEEAPHVIIDLKPCLMMSPLTVAQFLNPEIIKFDLIIFDEASQIPPEDSVGSILRGKQVIIAGDSKQLPPTSFFQSEVISPEDDDHAGDESKVEDLDSILDECAVSGLPRTMLRWHYRSRHESLIAFSNRYFYHNNLLTFPCADGDNPCLGIKFNYNPAFVYDRGGSGVNRDEALEVAKAILNHFKETPELTLGIGTFNIRQKFVIEDSIEDLLKIDNSLESFFSRDRQEHFFVKNLETIQGDERDVIFISVGYGKRPNGKLSMNFGPINQNGGARRLNVLITRARKRVEIFSSIRGDDFDLSRTESEGVKLLKYYLDYAEKGSTALFYDKEAQGDGDTESFFEDSVYNLLALKDINVRRQVGCSGYRIDLAVIDDANPGKYILGIECDGASYHSSATARDRDRLRQQILEDLDWRIYRIWSTDWFKNPRRELEKLLEVIAKAKKGDLKKRVDLNEFKIYHRQQIQKTNAIEVRKYVVTPIRKRFPSESFYQARSTMIASILKTIVEFEGPIHREEAWRRLIQHWNIRAIGSKVRQTLQSLENYCLSDNLFIMKGEFYWPADMIEPPVRVRKSSTDIDKKITFIAPEEICEAALLVLNKEYSIPIEEIIIQVANMIGFGRVTEDISQYIEDSIKRYIGSGRIKELNGKLMLGLNI